MTNSPVRYLSAQLSHQGVVRGNNEDRVYTDDARGIYLVIDGMGGHAAGERAAEIARDVIRVRLERQTGDSTQRMREAITLANNAIFEAASTHPEWAGMACVLTAVLIEGSQTTVGHVGDSRLYQLRRGSIEKLTPDHSPVGEREDRGELSEHEAMQHPRRNEVFRDVGSTARIPDEPGFIDVLTVSFTPESALLLCSDGLSDCVPAAKILSICTEHAGDRWTTVQQLVEAANERGKDNVSVVLIEGEQFAASLGRQSLTEPAASPGEDTARLTRTRRASGAWLIPLWIFAGMLLGSLLTFAVLQLRNPPAVRPTTRSVAAPLTVAEALLQSQPGDHLQLAPGTYAENITLKDGVSITGPGAIVRGVVSGSQVHGLTLSGLTITAVDLLDSAVQIERCVITGSTSAGVRLRGESAGLLTATEIRENAGPGVSIEGTSTTELRNNWILWNGHGGPAPMPGVWVYPTAHPVITGNTLAHNGAEAFWLPTGQEKLAAPNFIISAAPLKPFRIGPEAPR